MELIVTDYLFNDIKKDLVHLDDAQTLNWLFTFEAFRLAHCVEGAWEVTKTCSR